MAVKLWMAGAWNNEARLLRAHRLPPEFPFVLVREPNNPHDGNAVAIHASADALAEAGVALPVGHKSLKLGYVPAKMTAINWAARVAALLDAGKPVTCMLVDRPSNGPEMCVLLEGEGL